MKTILNNTWAVLDQRERRHFSTLVIADIFISILDILSLIALLWIIQFYIQPGTGVRLNFLPGWLANQHSVGFIAIFFFLFGIKNVAAYFIARAHFRFIGEVAVRISRNNLSGYQQAGFEEFVNIDSSSHIRKIAFQPFEFAQYVLSGIQQIITQLSLILIAIISILIFNARLFLLLLLILLPPVIVVFYIIKKRLGTARKHIRSNNERSYQYLLDALKGWVEGNIYNRNDFFLQRFISSRRQFSSYLFETVSLQNMPSRIIEIFALLGLFALIAIAKWTGNDDSATLITIGAFMAAAYKIIPGIVKVINVSGQIRAYEFAVGDLMADNKSATGPALQTPTTGLHSLQLKNINFEYPQQPVLKNFSFSARKGELLGISGSSGKGKTTILNLLLGFLKPADGEILVNEVPVEPGTLKSYWPFIAYVRQQSFFIHDTLLRNITLAEEDPQNKKLATALQIAGLNEVISKFPEGINTIITENGKNISGGQQQRIALARALYKDADLLLLDEPFNELDEKSTICLLEHFRKLASEGKIIILITHDKKSLAYFNKIISLDE